MGAARLVAFCAAAAACAARAQDPVAIPSFAYLNDVVGVTTPFQLQAFDIIGSNFTSRRGARVATLIVPSARPESVQQLARRALRQWQLEDGAILVIATAERAVHIENGSKGGITPEQASVIVEKIVAPMFEAAKPHLNVELGWRSILEMLENGPQAKITIFELAEAPQEPARPAERPRILAGVVLALVLLAATVLAARRRGMQVLAGPWLAIVAVNLVPAWGVVVEGWSVFPLFVIFWLDLVLLILTNGVRVGLARHSLLQAPLVWITQGLFAIGYGMAILAFFARPEYEAIKGSQDPLFRLLGVLDRLALWPQLTAMVVLHLLVLAKFVVFREHLTADAGKVEGEAMLRMILLHVAIFIGGALFSSFGFALWTLLILVALKIALEIGLRAGAVEFRLG